jgi:DNA-directed RNA polymerase alpha subunit
MERISEEASLAIYAAVKDEHSVFCLEQLGVPQKAINLLYNRGITKISDLVAKDRAQLLAIQNFGRANLKKVIDALCRYHEIEDI